MSREGWSVVHVTRQACFTRQVVRYEGARGRTLKKRRLSALIV